jgi:hypothetical protein
MSDVYLIEVKGRAVGLVARNAGDDGFRFHAAVVATLALDGRTFSSPGAAQHAAKCLMESTRPRPPRPSVPSPARTAVAHGSKLRASSGSMIGMPSRIG